jgi:hypothetical protein
VIGKSADNIQTWIFKIINIMLLDSFYLKIKKFFANTDGKWWLMLVNSAGVVDSRVVIMIIIMIKQ